MPAPDLSQQIADLRTIVLRANTPEVMTPSEAAEFIGVTTETLLRWRKDGWGPKYTQPTSRMVRYLKNDLMAFLKEHQHG